MKAILHEAMDGAMIGDSSDRELRCVAFLMRPPYSGSNRTRSSAI